ncbi:MAG: DUF86 domain-containing protein [Armatimonadetes bacterium]|nr:DUF86 domain-containing protein [Armatimonadota bacterium]MDW8028145.1 DUF86 domain-containing protein [Armatimonadota bacterium]
MRVKGLVKVDEQKLAHIIGQFPSVIAAYLFGSAARGEVDHFSDVDVAVLLEDDLAKEQRWRLVGDLQDNLMSVVGQDKVDVVDLETVPLWFQKVIIATGKVIYERDSTKRQDYENQLSQVKVEDDGRWEGMEEVRLRFETIERNLERLEELAMLSYEEFMADPRNLAAAERWLQTSIEALVDISRHLAHRLGLQMPEEYRQIPKVLAEAGYLPGKDVPTYELMISFRNRLVHRYPEVEPDEVYRIVTQGLGDIRRWRNQLMQALQQVAGTQGLG